MAISQDCSEFQENLGEFETFYRRFPRRFAPRNDKAEALCHTEDTPMFSPCLPSETSGWTGFSPARFAKTKCTAQKAGRSACRKVPSGLLPSCLQNCKTFCSTVLQFCRCGGLFDAKGNPDGFLSLFSSLRNLRLIRFFDTQTQKRNVPPGKPDGQLVKKSLRVFCQAAFKIAKLFVVLFCNFAAAAGYLTRKETLTVSFPSFLPSETFG